MSLDKYRGVAEDALLDEIHTLAEKLVGARIAHVNATANGGGVSEILKSLVPLYRDLGIDATWHVMSGNMPFYEVTKRIHNSLQGADFHLAAEEWDVYLSNSRLNADALRGGFDVVFLHDPQTAGIPQFANGAASRWVWRSHIDTSTPNPNTWSQIKGFVGGVDAVVFSVSDFIDADIGIPQVSIMPPVIDPFVPKNRQIPKHEAEAVIAGHGVDPTRPFISQVSRFDPWKDPLGVIECFSRLKKRHEELQLVLLGNFADDDPEGVVMYEQVVKAAEEVPDTHIVTGLTDEVGPFQQESRVVLQKSLREGFGLTVAEALWKRTPVVGGNVGGIRLQLADGRGGFLVDSIDEAVEKVDFLLSQEDEGDALAESGHEWVRANYLVPRLLRDELALINAF